MYDGRWYVKLFSKLDLTQSDIWSGLHVNLLSQELKQGFNQILIEIEIIMGHFNWEHKKRLPLAVFMKQLCMIVWNQGISLTMNNEGRAYHLWHHFQIIEVFCHHRT